MLSMEKYAVIKLGSKQFLIREGDVIELERQQKPLKIEVLMYFDGSESIIGEPELNNVDIKAEIIEDKLGEKVRVARFKKKSRYNKVKGHRQPVSVIKIEKIGGLLKVKEEDKKKVAKKDSEKVIVKKEKSPKKPVKKETKKLKGSK